MKDFQLKRYEVKEAFSSYKVGDIVAFNGVDAKRFEGKIKELKEDKKAEQSSDKAVKNDGKKEDKKADK